MLHHPTVYSVSNFQVYTGHNSPLITPFYWSYYSYMTTQSDALAVFTSSFFELGSLLPSSFWAYHQGLLYSLDVAGRSISSSS